MKIGQIRRELRKRRDSLFFTNAERALLAVLEAEPFRKSRAAIIDADYTSGWTACEKVTRRIIEEAWSNE